MATGSEVRDKPVKLDKMLGLSRLTVYGVGSIIGSGIYAVIGPAAGIAGPGIWLSFLFAALASAFSALSYAELASALPSAGAEHNFLRQAFPKLPVLAFIVGLFIAIHGSATLATVALTFAGYLRELFNVNSSVVAIVLMSLFTILNTTGLKMSSWVNVSFTVTQVSCLVILAVAAFTADSFPANISKVFSQPIQWDRAFGGTAIIFFIYTGYEHMAALSEEAKCPGRDLWKAFLLALIFTSIIYLAIILSVLGLVDADALASSNGPLAAAASTRGPLLGFMVTFAALLATANAVLSGSLSVSRIVFGMARAGDMPQLMTRLTGNSQSPWIAAIFVLIVSSAFASIGNIGVVASLSSFGALLVFALVNISVITLRITKPEMKRPFEIPGRILRIPIIPALGTLVSLALATQYSLSVYLLFCAGAGLGIFTYYVTRWPRKIN